MGDLIMIKVLSSGVYDILNLGHINILTQAKKLGDYLICCVQEDSSVKKSKGSLPILNTEERVQQIKALGFIDEVIVYKKVDQRDMWDKIKPNIIVQGDDYLHSGDRTKSIEYIIDKKIRLILLPRTENISSSIIKERVRNNLK
jgi:D-beta-D-heptose 7-phosphate kinase / D-beta-D-heptose 1-phosphate adenosyltransferase